MQMKCVCQLKNIRISPFAFPANRVEGKIVEPDINNTYKLWHLLGALDGQ